MKIVLGLRTEGNFVVASPQAEFSNVKRKAAQSIFLIMAAPNDRFDDSDKKTGSKANGLLAFQGKCLLAEWICHLSLLPAVKPAYFTPNSNSNHPAPSHRQGTSSQSNGSKSYRLGRQILSGTYDQQLTLS
jgi:hypothetical protein